MKKIFVLLFSFILLMLVFPVQASNIEYVDVGVDMFLSAESDCIDNINIESVSVLNSVVINSGKLTSFKTVIIKRNLFCFNQSSQEVDFVDTGYYVGYVINSNETIGKITNVTNVNVHFGTINFLDRN